MSIRSLIRSENELQLYGGQTRSGLLTTLSLCKEMATGDRLEVYKKVAALRQKK